MNSSDMGLQGRFVCSRVLALLTLPVFYLVMNSLNMMNQIYFVSSREVAFLTLPVIYLVMNTFDVLLLQLTEDNFELLPMHLFQAKFPCQMIREDPA